MIRLVEVETGRPIARLESPDASKLAWAAFSPDGSQLVLVSENQTIHLWDLRATRKQLAAMGLDWDAPAYPDKASPARPLPPAQVDLGLLTEEMERFTQSASTLIKRYTERIRKNPDDEEAYHQRAHALYKERRVQEGINDFEVALRLRPDDAHLRVSLAESCNNLAWLLSYAPRSTRNVKRALSHARRAVELAPNHRYYVNTLGIALYRAGQYAESIAILEQFLAGPRGGHGGIELFYLAMARHRHGERDQARVCLDRAVNWVKSLKIQGDGWHRQFAEYRTEAQAVLAGPADDLPVDTFAPSPEH